MSIIGDIFSFLLGIDEIFNSVESLLHDLNILVFNIKTEVDKIRRFRHDPHWKSRVINVPDAIKKTKDLIVDVAHEIHEAFVSLQTNIKGIIAEYKATRHGTGGGHGEAGVAAIVTLLTAIKNFVVEVDNSIKAMNSFVDALRKITEELEGLDSLFLQQGNPRTLVAQEKRPYIRVGKLHPSA
jgi:hypothetical protein